MRKKFFTYFKLMLFIIFGLVVLVVIATMIFVKTSPQMGRAPQGADLERLQQSPHFKEGVFVNLTDTRMGSFGEMMGTLPDLVFGKGGSPESPLPVAYGENGQVAPDSVTYVTWYGHSAFLLEMEGQRLLIDPMLGPVASPVPFGSKRFANEKAVPLEELTDIDAVIFSHDHYDHLDYPTVQQIKDEVGQWFTPLGVGSHLKSWDVDATLITELDWWETAVSGDVKLVAVPARHFSGRGFGDRNSTQWAGWVIEGTHQKLYFSGDGGYGPHFKEIGERHGPFDFAMMECGQYNKAWAQIHMMPEESVQAGIDANAKLLMPIHWGAFKLAVHSWRDPIERFTRESERLAVPVVHPRIGERFGLGQDFPQGNWWQPM